MGSETSRQKLMREVNVLVNSQAILEQRGFRSIANQIEGAIGQIFRQLADTFEEESQ